MNQVMDLSKFKKIPNVPFLLSEDGDAIVSEGERNRKTKIRISSDGEKFAVLKGVRYPLWYLIIACFSQKIERGIGIIYKDGNKKNIAPSNLTLEKFEEEIVENIPGYKGYFCSTRGRVFKKRFKVDDSLWVELKPQMLHDRKAVFMNNENGGKLVKTYRLVLLSYVGPCPEGMIACHNDGDVNNNHFSNLRWDTHKNNTLDRKKHNTYIFGENAWNASFKNSMVREIIEMRANKISVKEISKKLSIKEQAVRGVLSGNFWKKIVEQEGLVLPNINDRIKLNENDVIRIFQLNKNGIPSTKIAEQLNIDLGSIYSILNSRNWLHVDVPDEAISQERKIQRNARKLTQQ